METNLFVGILYLEAILLLVLMGATTANLRHKQLKDSKTDLSKFIKGYASMDTRAEMLAVRKFIPRSVRRARYPFLLSAVLWTTWLALYYYGPSTDVTVGILLAALTTSIFSTLVFVRSLFVSRKLRKSHIGPQRRSTFVESNGMEKK